MSTAVKSGKRGDNGNMTNTSVSKKLARNLNEEFDEYTLHEEYSFDQRSNQTPAKLLNQSMDHNKQNKDMKSNVKHKKDAKSNLTNDKMKEGMIPRSYLLAMQHLQDTVDQKEEEIEELKLSLFEKEKYIFQCEARINEVLKKCQDLTNNLHKKQVELDIVKAQNDQLRMDKDAAIKQAAKILESEYKPQFHEYQVTPGRISRSKTINEQKNSAHGLHRTPVETHHYNYEQMQDNFTKTQDHDRYSLKLNQNQSPAIVPPLMSYRPKQKNFISYQREILRNEKQMIALKYRMECLERKLLSNDGNKQETKQKIRKLSQDISAKQKLLRDLKQLL